MLDTNKDGEVDPKEFVEGLVALRIPSLNATHYKKLFEVIDMDNSRYLSLNEFAFYIEGAKQNREERMRSLPDKIKNEIKQQINDLFEIFDEDGNGRIDTNELIKTFNGLGYEMSKEKAEAMIKSVCDSMPTANKSGLLEINRH